MSTETILAEAVSIANEEAAIASEAFGDAPQGESQSQEQVTEPVQDEPQASQDGDV